MKGEILMQKMFGLLFAMMFSSMAVMGGEVRYFVEPMPDSILDPALDGKPCYACVSTLVLRVSFPKPTDLRRLVTYRAGRFDWAVANCLEVSANDGAPRRIAVSAFGRDTATRLGCSPSVPVLAERIAPDGAESVTSLVVRCTKTTAYGRVSHGLLPLALSRGPVFMQELTEGDRCEEGVEVTVDTPRTIVNPSLVVPMHRFGGDILFTAPIAALPQGRSVFRVLWSDFSYEREPETRILPANVARIGLFADGADGSVAFSVRGVGAKSKGALAMLPPFDGPKDADSWYRGIPSDGFGSFGFHYEENGELYGLVRGNSLVCWSGEPQNTEFGFGSGDGLTTVWNRAFNCAQSITLERLNRHGGEYGSAPASYAYGEYDISRLPERLTYGSMAPGVLLRSSDRVFTISSPKDFGAVHLLLPTKAGLVWRADESIALSELSEGWTTLVFEKLAGAPLVIAFDRRPAKAVRQGSGCRFEFGGPRGWIGLARASGIRSWSGKASCELGAAVQDLACSSRQLAQLLRNYPYRSEMRFRCEDKTILFEERPAYIRWTNAWGESGGVRVPCPPLIAFAADMGYPVSFPDGVPQKAAPDTLFGPYRAWDASKCPVARYRLPKGKKDFTIYPRPIGSHEAKGVADSATLRLRTEHSYPEVDDCICGWCPWASSSCAQAYFSPGQTKELTELWRPKAAYILSDNHWFVRREPIGGKEYPVSFAWTDEAERVLGDINSGIGAALSGIDRYAAFSGDWDFVRKNWQKIRRIPLNWVYEHGWTMLQSGSREQTAASGIDMDVITYEGMAALARMAETIGENDAQAMAEMMLSRYALMMCAKNFGPAWQTLPCKTPHAEWDVAALGLYEGGGFWTRKGDNGSPGIDNALFALNLSWSGMCPPLYEQLISGCGGEFWRIHEYEFIEKKLKGWRRDLPPIRNCALENVAAHILMRLMIGGSREEARADMGRADVKLNFYNSQAAACCTAMMTYLLSGDAPVAMASADGARLVRFDWDRKSGSVVAELESERVFSPRFRIRGTPTVAPQTIVSLPAGRKVLEWRFDNGNEYDL